MHRNPFPSLLRSLRLLLLEIAIIPLITATASAQDVYKTFHKQDYADSRDREYIVHLPKGVVPKGRPMLMVLHGCDQNHETIKHDTMFDQFADQGGFIVVYPFITSYGGMRATNCWGWWMPEQIHRGAGEVEDLAGIAREVQRDYGVPPKRTFIAGVSSGAGLTVAALVAHPEIFVAGASVAGQPYGETSSAASMGVCQNPGIFKPVDEIVKTMTTELAGAMPGPILIVHSTGDCMIKIKSSENIRDSWGKVLKVDTKTPVSSSTGSTKGTNWTLQKYGMDLRGNSMIDTLFVEGLPHGWYGDGEGKYAFPNAPDTSQIAWEFFKTRFLKNLIVTVKDATAETDSKPPIRVTGTVSYDSPLSQVKVAVELLGLAPQEARPAKLDPDTKTYFFESSSDLPNNTYYRPRVKAADAEGNMATCLGPLVAIGNPPKPDPPKLTIDSVNCSFKSLVLSGTVEDRLGVDTVSVQVDGQAWIPAELNQDAWSLKGPGLSEGAHVIDVRATNLAAQETISQVPCKVVLPWDAQQQSDITGHLIASRIKAYPKGFGSADKTYMELFQAYGASQQFTLYRGRIDKYWYAERENVPLGASVRPETTTTLRPDGGQTVATKNIYSIPATQDLYSTPTGKPCCP